MLCGKVITIRNDNIYINNKRIQKNVNEKFLILILTVNSCRYSFSVIFYPPLMFSRI